MPPTTLDHQGLAEARRNAGISQQIAASRAGVALSTLQNAEAGKNEIRGSVVAFLARLYGITADSLYVHTIDGTPAGTACGESSDTEPRPTLPGVEGAGSTTGE